jgi:fumarate reductase flavoprotein subunit
MSPSGFSEAEKLETDILVVGGGGGGLAAAVAAGEKGAKVTVLEKRTAWGGNSALAGGIFAAESPVQKRMMIDARKEDLFKKAMDYSHWKADPEIVRAFVYKSGDTVRWLEEKGLKFVWIPPLYPNQAPRVLHWPEGGGAALVRLLVNCCENLGVRLLQETPATRILTDGQGRVTGVVAAKDSREITVHARAVIIATGGFGGNKELLRKYDRFYSDNRLLTAIPHTGDGLLMCLDAGSATEGLGLLLLSGPRVPGSFLLSAVAAEPSPMMVNSLGKRFSDENIPCHFERGNTVDRQPDKISFALFDTGIKQIILDQGLKRPGWGLQREVLHLQPRIDPGELNKELLEQEEKGVAKISRSWDELARWMSVPPEILISTVSEYNRFCDRGRDELFAKDPKHLLPLQTPPYYAVRCRSGFLGTIGGVKINHRMEVLNHKEKPIHGLFAAGVDTGGWQGDTYSGRDLAGSAFGFAVNSGRIAGENAAVYASCGR